MFLHLQRRIWGVRRLRRAPRAAAVGALVGLSIAAPSADAESLTPPHLAAYGLDWIARVPVEDQPAVRPAVCLIDSGVAVTPDTPADSPGGPILARLAIDGGTGLPQGSGPEYEHGTQMAAQIIAPANGWGIVGVWPWGRLISVRATVGTTTGYSSAAYLNAALACLQWASTNNVSVAAINFSLGSSGGGGTEAANDADLALQAHATGPGGISVVAAGGNIAGAQTPLPARAEGILSVGAGTSSPPGGWCSYATHDSRTDIVGPACPVVAPYLPTGDEVSYDGGGSSTASAVASGAIAALRTLRPDSRWSDAEGWLGSGTAVLNGAVIIDGRAAAAAAGLSGLVTPAPAVTPATTPTTQPAGHVPRSSRGASRLPRPTRISVRWFAGRLLVSTRAKIPGARLQVRVGTRVATASRGARRVSIRAPRSARSLSVRWVAVDAADHDSRPAIVRRPARGWQ